ncbi:hypothetical protein EGW08_019646 [Elysia chlorotica]|uniref:Uncharacterized protein n=1 Tax=Elysia chlorotica TaxID=188477 RepID=A0A3S1H5G3_ELYCH|nr:hypothetical protein EGW08_019646 [Elysia chlorotica]
MPATSTTSTPHRGSRWSAAVASSVLVVLALTATASTALTPSSSCGTVAEVFAKKIGPRPRVPPMAIPVPKFARPRCLKCLDVEIGPRERQTPSGRDLHREKEGGAIQLNTVKLKRLPDHLDASLTICHDTLQTTGGASCCSRPMEDEFLLAAPEYLREHIQLSTAALKARITQSDARFRAPGDSSETATAAGRPGGRACEQLRLTDSPDSVLVLKGLESPAYLKDPKTPKALHSIQLSQQSQQPSGWSGMRVTTDLEGVHTSRCALDKLESGISHKTVPQQIRKYVVESNMLQVTLFALVLARDIFHVS